jgi:serine/threonine protein kinase
MKPHPSRPARCGDYELVSYLTAGGMADLYLARSPRHTGDLVVKTIQPRYLEYTRVVKMFIDEGRIAQALEHPHIVKIVDVGHADGSYFIAMEYIPGKDLVAICRRGVEVQRFIPRELGAAIICQTLRGLIHAHEKRDADGRPLRVVHCDISPGNIVVSWGGTAKIVDFGIARATIQLRTEDESVAGKYNYMAPEQIRGEAIDARADLFAVGAILYELTVGKRLFRGRPEQVMRRVLEADYPAPREVHPDFPVALEAIITRALALDPADRWPSAREMYGALREWLEKTGAPHGKRELAEYLRAIFGGDSRKLVESEEFGGGGDDDDELRLTPPLKFPGESGLLQLPVEVDPELPESELVAPAPPPAGPSTHDARLDAISAAYEGAVARDEIITAPVPKLSPSTAPPAPVEARAFADDPTALSRSEDEETGVSTLRAAAPPQKAAAAAAPAASGARAVIVILALVTLAGAAIWLLLR